MNRPRQQELENMTGAELRQICKQYGIEKPESGQWKDAIGKILEWEGDREIVPSSPENPIFAPDPTDEYQPATINLRQRGSAAGMADPLIATENGSILSGASVGSGGVGNGGTGTVGNWKFSTPFYDATNLDRCPKCGEKRRFDLNGNRLCAIGQAESCPVLLKLEG